MFALLTPFYFLIAGTKVYMPALWAGLGLVVILLAVKMVDEDGRRVALDAVFWIRPA